MKKWIIFLLIMGGLLVLLLPEARGWIIAGVLVLLAGLWFFISYTRTGRLEPTEMGVIYIFGRMVKAVGPGGLHFVPWLPSCGILRYSTQQYNLDFPPVTVYTKQEAECGAQPIEIDGVAFLFMPRADKAGGKERLLKVAKAKIPATEEGLVEHLTKHVQSVLQQAIGSVTWKKLIPGLKEVKDKADELFKGEHSVLVEAGFTTDDFSLAMVIHLPPELEHAISQPDIEELKSRAAVFAGEADFSRDIRPVLIGFAESIGVPFKDLQKKIQKNHKLRRELWSYVQEVNLKLRQAKLGARYDIGVEGATGIDKSFLQLITVFKKLFSGDGPGRNPSGNVSPVPVSVKKKTRNVDLMIGGALHSVELDERDKVVAVQLKS